MNERKKNKDILLVQYVLPSVSPKSKMSSLWCTFKTKNYSITSQFWNLNPITKTGDGHGNLYEQVKLPRCHHHADSKILLNIISQTQNISTWQLVPLEIYRYAKVFKKIMLWSSCPHVCKWGYHVTLYGQHHQNEYEEHRYDARLKDLTKTIHTQKKRRKKYLFCIASSFS